MWQKMFLELGEFYVVFAVSHVWQPCLSHKIPTKHSEVRGCDMTKCENVQRALCFSKAQQHQLFVSLSPSGVQTGKALSYINKQYFSDANGNRGGAPNVAVVLVDGWPTDKVEEASRLARESGINIFFVTIEGPDENEKQNLVEANFVDKVVFSCTGLPVCPIKTLCNTVFYFAPQAVCRTNGFFSLPVNSWFALRKAVQPLVKRVCDTDRLVCSKTCINANDIAFVIDGSSSVGTGNFRTVLQFVANVTREFEISDTDTRVGAVQYTYEQRLEFAFGQYNNKAELLNAIKRINYWSGGTSTGAAITFAAEQLFSKSKPNKRKIMIVITDGRSYDDVRAPALAVHRQGETSINMTFAFTVFRIV